MMQTSKLSSAEKACYASRYVKYRGVFIDKSLNWKTHINKVSSKLFK